MTAPRDGAPPKWWPEGVGRTPLALPALALTLAGCGVLPADPAVEDSHPPAAFAPAATSATFEDAFDSPLDPAVWQVGTHALGKGRFQPENVEVSGGRLLLHTPAGTWDGGEVRTRQLHARGTFTARLRCGVPGGALCAFFLYQTGVGDRADEIDIEILPGGREVMFTTWVRGRQTNHARWALPAGFDPAAFHEYTIVHASNATEFWVDGVRRARFTKQLPKQSMNLFLSAWWPTWLNGESTGGRMEVEEVRAY